MNVALQRLRELRAHRYEQNGVSNPTSRPRLYIPSPLDETERGYLVPAGLPERWREWYEERAAIREYDGGQSREHAEAEAL